MPDDTADAVAAASQTKPAPAVNPDRVGEELADDARIWHVYDRVAKEDDERRTKQWDNGLNNLALFAGLFSAVTTAFIIEARQDLEPDYAQMTFIVLNATAFGEKPVHQPFDVAPSARAVNSLWIASLILSLSASLIAIMGKDWIGMYTARPVCSLRQWAEMRTYRMLCVERWYMSGVIASAPVLLHVSLLLFGAGLILFISSDPFTHHLTLGLSLAAGVLYLVTTLSAVVFSASPFKSPATQMIRAALSAFYSYVCSIIYRPKRKPLRTLMCEIHALVLGRAAGTFLPGGSADNGHYSGLRPRIDNARRAAIVYMRKIPTWVRTVHSNLQWVSVQSHLHSIASAVHHLSVDWFLSSTWTDLPAARRPKLLAEALSWLSSASPAPDVFRAIVFALGDLDGPQVGRHTSIMLHTRLRAEIRRIWQQADFLMFSRYVLADQNTPGEPVLAYYHFEGQFDISKNPALRCEDGLAALIRLDLGYIRLDDLVRYSPDQVAQPRMLEFLLPRLRNPHDILTDVSILLSHRYRAHLWDTNSFNFGNLEAHLYQTLSAPKRDAYATAVTVEYGGTSGAIELLTFLCCHSAIGDDTKPAAVELVMELLQRLPAREHRCLAYLFGSSDLWDTTWKGRHWSRGNLYSLTDCLAISCDYPFGPCSVRTLTDDRRFDFALSRAVVMLASLLPFRSAWEVQFVRPLQSHLSQWLSPSVPDIDDDERADVIRLIFESAALSSIVGVREYNSYCDDVVISGTAILAAIISQLDRRLRNPDTIRDGEQLFAALAHTEVNTPHGGTLWDLGDWLRTEALVILKQHPSSTAAMRDVHVALSTIYPLCEHNPRLRASWDHIGYSGPPADVIYFSDPFLDLGDFFASAEDALSLLGV